jgi:hypothetical protein
MYAIQSIHKKILLCDILKQQKSTDTLGQNLEPEETVETFIFSGFTKIIDTSATTCDFLVAPKAGTSSNKVKMVFGVSQMTNLRDGVTILDGQNGMGRGLYMGNEHWKLEGELAIARKQYGISTYGMKNSTVDANIVGIGCYYPFYLASFQNSVWNGKMYSAGNIYSLKSDASNDSIINREIYGNLLGGVVMDLATSPRLTFNGNMTFLGGSNPFYIGSGSPNCIFNGNFLMENGNSIFSLGAPGQIFNGTITMKNCYGNTQIASSNNRFNNTVTMENVSVSVALLNIAGSNNYVKKVVSSGSTGGLIAMQIDGNKNRVMEFTSTGDAVVTGIYFVRANNFVHNATFNAYATRALRQEATSGDNYMINCKFAGAGVEWTEMNPTQETGVFFWSHNHNQIKDNHFGFTEGALVQYQTTGGRTIPRWTCFIKNVARTTLYRVEFPIAKVKFMADKNVTVKCWVKKSHATDIAAGLICKGGQIDGVPIDVTTTKANDTTYQELTLSFTPTEKGVVEIMAQAWWLANLADESVDFCDTSIIIT